MVAIAFVSIGCQLIVPSDAAQCSTDRDCDERGGAFAKSVCVDELCLPVGDRCLGHVAPVVEDPSTMLHSRVRFVNVADVPERDIEVLVCASRDEFCKNPLGSARSDPAGYADMNVPKNFRGTLQVKIPPGSDLMKTKVHALTPFEVADPPDLVIPPQAAVHLITRSLFASQVQARAPLDPNAGHIIAATVDCALAPRGGVSVSVTSDLKGREPIAFYFNENRSASVTATETGAEGAFGFANVPAGPVVIEARIPSLGRKAARVELWINEDTISTFQLAPSFLPP
jgi:hypothetical protein